MLKLDSMMKCMCIVPLTELPPPALLWHGLLHLWLPAHQLVRHALGVGVHGWGLPHGASLEHAERLRPPVVRLVSLQMYA